ncbi:MAG TPA: slipin family protein [Spirochaetota bacterium]|nr:slipin family protein [Spirochaetota bacterium]
MNKKQMDTNETAGFCWKFTKKIFGFKRYGLNILLLFLSMGFFLLFHKTAAIPPFFSFSVPVLLLLTGICIRIAFEWERVPVLRLGKFYKTKGPGIFFVIPVIDTIIEYLDCRIIVTDFSAEKVLTKDAVPVYVDAIIFWMIWDAGKAKLEVENYEFAVPLSAKTALRDIIGRNNLSKVLTDREGVGRELQQILDHKTNPWGITSLSVDIKDIIIPPELEDVMSKEAQAEREKKARIILSKAEEEIAGIYARAAEQYTDKDKAMTLRSLNILMETLKKEGSMIMVPSEVPHLMNKGVAAAIAKTQGMSPQQNSNAPEQ